jgi:hypothetical protein
MLPIMAAKPSGVGERANAVVPVTPPAGIVEVAVACNAFASGGCDSDGGRGLKAGILDLRITADSGETPGVLICTSAVSTMLPDDFCRL